MNKLKRLIITILVFLVAIIIFFQIKENIIMKYFDLGLFIVRSGSMNPELKIGDVIIVKKYNQYRIGDIITFKEKDNYITHRIINVINNKYVTKGDFNNTEDLELVKNDNVIGKVIYVSKHYLDIFKIIIIVYFSTIIIYIVVKFISKDFFYKKFINKFKLNKRIKNISIKEVCLIIIICIVVIIILIFMLYTKKTYGRYFNEIKVKCDTEIAKPIIDISPTESKLMDRPGNYNDIYIRNYKYNELTGQNEVNKVKMLCTLKIRKFKEGEEVDWLSMIQVKMNDELLKLNDSYEYKFLISSEEMQDYHLNFFIMRIDSMKYLQIYADMTFEQVS